MYSKKFKYACGAAVLATSAALVFTALKISGNSEASKAEDSGNQNSDPVTTQFL